MVYSLRRVTIPKHYKSDESGLNLQTTAENPFLGICSGWIFLILKNIISDTELIFQCMKIPLFNTFSTFDKVHKVKYLGWGNYLKLKVNIKCKVAI